MKNANSQKITVTIPGTLANRFNQHNDEHPEQPLKMSAILQIALDTILKEKGY